MKKRLSVLTTVLLIFTLLLPASVFAAPLPPGGLTATVISATQVDLAWTDNAVDETGFSVERSADGVTWAAIGAPAVDAATFSDTTVTAGATYFYRVLANGPLGDSAPSNVVSTTVSEPNAPSDLSAHIMSATRVDLVWTDQSNNESSFRIERSLDGFATAPTAAFTAAVNQRTYSDTTVVQTNTYYYRVIAINSIDSSAPSNVALARVTGALQVGPLDPRSIYLGNPNTGMPGYYQDDLGTRVSLLPISGNGLPAPPQIFAPPVLSNPYSVFLGYGSEAFYYIATTVFNTSAGKALALFGLEEAFGGIGNAEPGQEFVFARTRIRADLPVAGTYTVIHPYGTETFDVTTPGVKAINFTSDIGVPRDFTAAANANITRFLRQTVPPPPAGWIGDGGSVGPVTGSPTGFNAVRIVGPAGSNLDGRGNNFVESNLFSVSGRLLNAVLPVAGFTRTLNPVTGIAPNTVTFTDTSTGAPTAWSWDFGDGTTSALQNPTKAYAAAGNYTVRLTVTNAAGRTSTSQTVSLFSIPVASFTNTLPNGLPPVTINFTDTSTGNPASWLWDFGDGATSTLQNPPKVYAAAGAYTVTLTVTNPAGSASTSQVVRVSGALVAGFTKVLAPADGVAEVTVTFTNTSTGAITAWLWDFGDGTTSTLQAPPPKVYAAAGNYTVSLTVTDAAGSAGTSQVVSVYRAPAASFSMSAATGVPPLAVNFTDTSTGNPASWLWDFGDGATSTLQNPGKTFAIAGAYTVTLTVTNPAGTDPSSQTVTVSLAFASPNPIVLQAGPIDPNSIYLGNPNTGLPAYYQDSDGTRVTLLPIAGDGLNAPTQIFDPPVLSNPYSVFLGYGTEAFYYIASSTTTTSTGRMVTVFGVEAAFGGAGNAVPGQEFVFTRTRIVADVPAPGIYTFQHPWGTETIDVTAADIAAGGGIFFTNDVGVPRDFLVAGTSKVSSFLRQTVPVPPVGWIGDGASVGPVTGSPTGFNAVRLTGPVGVNLDGRGNNFVETNQFSVAGRLFTLLTPSFTVALSPISGAAPNTATFADTTTGAVPTSWLWNFGDGATDIVPNPFHTYAVAGIYTVTLTVSDATGTASTSRTVNIISAPVASFTKSAAAGFAPLTVNFTDTSTGNPVSWLWGFGDGTGSTLQNPTHVYGAAGTFTVTLTATNAVTSSLASQTLVVSGPLAPPVAPALVAPANAATVASLIPVLSWNAAAGAATYNVVVSLVNDTAFASPVASGAGLTTLTFPVPAGAFAPNTRYAWRVTALNAAGSANSLARTFRTAAGSLPPRLLTPRNGTRLANLTPQLTWSPVAGIASYDVQVTTDAAFSALAAQATALAVTSFDVPAGALRGGTLYFWRVRVTTDLGTSLWSSRSSFRTPIGPAAAPRLTSPRGRATSLTPTLVWANSPGATSYDVQVATDARFTALVVDQAGIAGLSFALTTPLASGTRYFWRVRAVNANGASAFATTNFLAP